MADQAALFGLVGALGGAVLGAGGAVVVPLLTRRHAQRDRRRSRAEDEFTRLLGLRQSTRHLQELLDPSERLPGGIVEPWTAEQAREFEGAFNAAIRAVRDAADQLEIYGYRFVHTVGTDRRNVPPESESLSAIQSTAMDLKHVILAYVGHPNQQAMDMLQESFPPRLHASLVDSRRNLLWHLLERMEALRKAVS
ncbi:hypothetical protein [Streptomyces sp. NPDC002067]